MTLPALGFGCEAVRGVRWQGLRRIVRRRAEVAHGAVVPAAQRQVTAQAVRVSRASERAPMTPRALAAVASVARVPGMADGAA